MLHARHDYNRIQDPAGLIPKDEPVFLLRAQDVHASKAVFTYATLVEAAGGDPAVVALSRMQAEHMEAWSVKKSPDVPHPVIGSNKKYGLLVHSSSQKEVDALPSGDELEAAVAATPGEKVTKEFITSHIVNTVFYVLPNSTVTICSITLDNGFSVRGESACVDPTNFDFKIGERYAFDAAFDKLWAFYGFLLAEDRKKRDLETAMASSIKKQKEGICGTVVCYHLLAGKKMASKTWLPGDYMYLDGSQFMHYDAANDVNHPCKFSGALLQLNDWFVVE